MRGAEVFADVKSAWVHMERYDLVPWLVLLPKKDAKALEEFFTFMGLKKPYQIYSRDFIGTTLDKGVVLSELEFARYVEMDSPPMLRLIWAEDSKKFAESINNE